MFDLENFNIALSAVIEDYRTYDETNSITVYLKTYHSAYLFEYKSEAHSNHEEMVQLIKNEEKNINAWLETDNFKKEWLALSSQDRDNILSFSPLSHKLIRSKIGLEDIDLSLKHCFYKSLIPTSIPLVLSFIKKELGIEISRPINEAQLVDVKNQVESATRENFPEYSFKTSFAEDWFIDALFLVILQKFGSPDYNKKLKTIDKNTPISLKSVFNLIDYSKTSNQEFLIGVPLRNFMFLHHAFEEAFGRSLDIQREKKSLEASVPSISNSVSNPIVTKNIKV